MYMGRRVVVVRVSVILPDIRSEWVVAALVKEIKLQYDVMSSNRAKFVNWWGYGLDIFMRTIITPTPDHSLC